jgi:DNA polymerase-3 subunit gamma/tau
MEELNRLLNAGNSPSQMARQLVRYLRNCLMAKLGGEKTELLQISGDERARAMRSATLFGEEDLTRFLQVMLRTFDELNYRQEPRLHLELGLMKLVHLQRLSAAGADSERPAGCRASGYRTGEWARSVQRPSAAPRDADPAPVEPASQNLPRLPVRAGPPAQAGRKRRSRYRRPVVSSEPVAVRPSNRLQLRLRPNQRVPVQPEPSAPLQRCGLD